MNRNWQILGMLISLLLLGTGVFYLNQNMYSNRLAAQSKHANPVRLYIHREIKADLYKHSDGPESLTGWEMSGIGHRGNEGMVQTKTSSPSGRHPQQARADSAKAGNKAKDLDSLASANRDSAASR